MKIRFGYVSTALNLWEASPSRTLTFKRYGQLGKEEGDRRLLEVTRENLRNTLRIFHYNIAHEIEVYRLSSSLVPLATHPEIMWDFVTPFKEEWKQLGTMIKEHALRVSFHPSQYTLFTSTREELTANSVKDMVYHYQMLEAMGVQNDSNINIHVGGAYGDKIASVKRFHENIVSLPHHIKEAMTLENDDKTYTTEETLAVCEKEDIPLAFDYHHHMANPTDMPIEEILRRVSKTWERTGRVPKIHISSPKNEKDYRHHADYVDLDFIMPLLKTLKDMDLDVDFMIEAKTKDKAALQLVEDVSKIRGIKRISGASIKW
ncbi:UV DNA damage repair endonuclease UvsE [Peribacillus deserti]|uniref:UV DNA damage endonuclease n=1 Tax=Peribacillus deserti TaxID=673318 RepID=A0A2N5MBC5_9BACI|nr:UV DNA damage repair endonuclease UvsE [Peribacillus deserti]PLT31662.1 UV DNA damage repair endonuclease UvsE [Peribacillus deserti]